MLSDAVFNTGRSKHLNFGTAQNHFGGPTSLRISTKKQIHHSGAGLRCQCRQKATKLPVRVGSTATVDAPPAKKRGPATRPKTVSGTPNDLSPTPNKAPIDIDQFSKDVRKSRDRKHLARLKERLRTLSRSGGERFGEQGLKEFMEDSTTILSADSKWHLQVLLALLNQAYQVQEEAAHALAEAALADSSFRDALGDVGGIADLREVVETPSFPTSDHAAAMLALWAACKDAPANACLLVQDEDVFTTGLPKVFVGVAMKKEIGPAGREVGQLLRNSLYIKRYLSQGFASWQEEHAKGKRDNGVDAVEDTLASVCGEGKNMFWKMLLPYLIIQLLLGRCQYIKGCPEDRRDWGLALLTDRKSRHADEVGEVCLEELQALKGSAASSIFEKERAAWALGRYKSSLSGE